MTMRDTQFAGFAKLLWEEMQDRSADNEFEDKRRVGPEYTAYMQLVIAQRAYDLVMHAIARIDPADLDRLSTAETVARIPDLTAWPPEES